MRRSRHTGPAAPRRPSGTYGQLPIMGGIAGVHMAGFAGFIQPIPAVLPQRLKLAEPDLVTVA